MFAESEMISLFSQGAAKEDIIQAANRVGRRQDRTTDRPLGGQAGGHVLRRGWPATGAWPLNWRGRIGGRLIIPDNVDRVGALGAALLARE